MKIINNRKLSTINSIEVICSDSDCGHRQIDTDRSTNNSSTFSSVDSGSGLEEEDVYRRLIEGMNHSSIVMYEKLNYSKPRFSSPQKII